ncbi:MAG TPA: CYTH and CHAD domain-containing protein [Jatrophihabitans sp.]|nr:CYTH and CHAD domain-containing protein [Jatrophihabitans sp.]
MSASVEREVKMLAPQAFELPSMDGALPGLTDGVPTRMELDATYYDTEDLTLARTGVTLRYRSGESGAPWTVKLPKQAAASTLTRLEIRFDGAPDNVPAAARDLVRGYLRSRRLRPVARLHTQRTCVLLLDVQGNSIAELVDDLVTAFDGERQIGLFHEVELELVGTRRRRRLQRAAAQRLAAAGCTTPAPALPKLARALGERATAPADLIIPPLDAAPTVADLIRHSLTRSVDRLIRHDAGVRLGEDPEPVHQFRVAARTLRSNLKTFSPVLDREWAGVLGTELAWLGSAAGMTRDLDVLEQRLRRTTAAALSADDAPGRTMLFNRLGQQKRQARKAMLSALRSDRYDSLLDTLVDGAAAPRLADDAPVDAVARAFLRRVARTQVRRLDRVVAGAADPPSDTDLHVIRIQAKRTRYAIEAARPVIGRPAKDHAAALAHLQDVLGEFHDSAVAVQWLREAAAARPTCGLVAGQLIVGERAEQAQLRQVVHDAWRAAGGSKLRRWL